MTARFSVLTTVFDPDPKHLRACLDSVRDQTYAGAIQHVVVDDASTRRGVHGVLNDSAGVAGRVTVRRDENGGIVAASNDAVARATGEWVVLVDHDDVLAPHALERLAEAIRDAPLAEVVYSDHDLLRPDGRIASPVYKPDFSLERLRNHNWITHLVAIRRTALEHVGGFADGTDGAQDHDLLLRLAESFGEFHHVPEVLLHWRQSEASVASDTANKPAAFDNGVAAVRAHLERIGVAATVEAGARPGLVRIRRQVLGRPTVTVVIPTRGTRGSVWGAERIFVHDAVSTLLDRSNESGVDIEVIAVVDSGTEPVVVRGLHALAGDRLVVIDYDRPFNFSDKINVGAAAGSGDFILMLNDDTELIEPGSVAEMVSIAQQRDVGMVGAKLLFEDGTLQHGGHSYHGTISHVCLGWPGDHPGPNHMLAVERECAGVTAAAAMLRRSVFNEIGGLNTDFAANYNDVDLSLTVRQAGYRIVWTPHASWFHFEQRSFDHPIVEPEVDRLRRRWGDTAFTDPFANPNLTPGRTDWLELPLRSGAPPYEVLDDGAVSWG
ncbi:MAG: glycosyltransferase [Ilumatobacter sp.]